MIPYYDPVFPRHFKGGSNVPDPALLPLLALQSCLCPGPVRSEASCSPGKFKRKTLLMMMLMTTIVMVLMMIISPVHCARDWTSKAKISTRSKIRIKRTPVQVAGLPRVESPPRPPGELPDWQVAQVGSGELLSS